MFGRKLPFWGPIVSSESSFLLLNFEIETKSHVTRLEAWTSSQSSAQTATATGCTANPCFFLLKNYTSSATLSSLSFFTINRIHMGKENQQQIPQDFENLFHQRKNGRLFSNQKKYPPCWSSKTTTSSDLAFRRSISSWKVWRFGSQKNGQPKRWQPKRTFWKSRLVAVQVDGLL